MNWDKFLHDIDSAICECQDRSGYSPSLLELLEGDLVNAYNKIVTLRSEGAL